MLVDIRNAELVRNVIMSKYYLILLWVGICAVFAWSGRLSREETVMGSREKRNLPWFAFLVFLPIILMAATRGYFADTGFYIKSFQNMPASFFEIAGYMEDVTKDRGFFLLSCLIKVFISGRVTVYLGIIALMQGISVITFFRKYSHNYIVSVFLFVASTDYISWMFNGMRQFLAVALILFATPWMLKRKYIQTVAVILLASTFHLSALLMIPLVIIAQGRAWNRKTLLYIAGVILAIVFVDKFTGILNDTLAFTQYQNVVADYTASEDNGTNILRVLVYSVPALLGFAGRHYIARSHDRVISFCTNMSVISAGLYFVSWVTSGIYIGRLPIYASMYSYILLPWSIENMFRIRSRRLIYLLMALFYLAFYYYQVHITWHIA